MQLELSKKTWFHKINPTFKLLIVIILFTLVLFTHNVNFMINFTLGLLFMYFFFTGHKLKTLLIITIPFVIIFISSSVSMIFFGKGDVTWYQFGLIHITKESFYRGIHIGFRGLVFALLGIVFSLTTRPVLLFYSLMQQVKLKPKYAYSFMAAFRLIPIMLEEMETLKNAFIVRGVHYQKGLKGFYIKLKSYSIPLLSQSIRRAHRIAVAMEAKRFTDTNKRTYFYKVRFSKYDFIFFFTILIILLCSFIVSIYYPYIHINDIRF